MSCRLSLCRICLLSHHQGRYSSASSFQPVGRVVSQQRRILRDMKQLVVFPMSLQTGRLAVQTGRLGAEPVRLKKHDLNIRLFGTKRTGSVKFFYSGSRIKCAKFSKNPKNFDELLESSEILQWPTVAARAGPVHQKSSFGHRKTTFEVFSVPKKAGKVWKFSNKNK